MQNSSKLQLILKVNKVRLGLQATQLKSAALRLQKQKQHYDFLTRALVDYTEQANKSYSTQNYILTRNFVTKMQTVLTQQEKDLSNLQSNFEAIKSSWLKQYHYNNNLTKIYNRKVKEEIEQKDKWIESLTLTEIYERYCGG